MRKRKREEGREGGNEWQPPQPPQPSMVRRGNTKKKGKSHN
jgi:hypothetical protein